MTEHDKHTISSFEATVYELAELAQHARVVHLAVRALAGDSSVARVGYADDARLARGDLFAAVMALDSAADRLLSALATTPVDAAHIERVAAAVARQAPCDCDCALGVERAERAWHDNGEPVSEAAVADPLAELADALDTDAARQHG